MVNRNAFKKAIMRHLITGFAGLIAISTVLLLARPHASASTLPVYHRVATLRSSEGTFGYARISPDGNLLAYASEPRVLPADPTGSSRVVIVDLRQGRQVFSEPGIDAYWSPDGHRIIYYSDTGGVSIFHLRSGHHVSRVAPPELGDYYSWGLRNGKNVIMTIDGNYYGLRGDTAELPPKQIANCGPSRPSERPLISKDGRLVSVFSNGTIVVRQVANCRGMIDTGIRGAKADFSWDGRYLAFHAPKGKGKGFEIRVVDLVKRSVRTLAGLPGSSDFPSWTEDNRLCFRYEGPDFRGFIIASNVLGAREQPLPERPDKFPSRRTWKSVFPASSTYATSDVMLMVWSPASAHSAYALAELVKAGEMQSAKQENVKILAGAADQTPLDRTTSYLLAYGRSLEAVSLTQQSLQLTEGVNQNPSYLLFRQGTLVSTHLGAFSAPELNEWMRLKAAGRVSADSLRLP